MFALSDFYNEQYMRQVQTENRAPKNAKHRASNISKVEMYPFQINARSMNLSGVLGLIFNYEGIARRIQSELVLWKRSSCRTTQHRKVSQTMFQFVPELAHGSQSSGSLSPG